MNDPRPRIPDEAIERQHEQRDLGLGVLFLSLVALLLLVAAAVIGMFGFQGLVESRAAASDPPPSPLVETDVQPPQPRLESDPGEVLARLRLLERVQLERYAWIDRGQGIARVPVERAMEILAERGLDGVDLGGVETATEQGDGS